MKEITLAVWYLWISSVVSLPRILTYAVSHQHLLRPRTQSGGVFLACDQNAVNYLIYWYDSQIHIVVAKSERLKVFGDLAIRDFFIGLCRAFLIVLAIKLIKISHLAIGHHPSRNIHISASLWSLHLSFRDRSGRFDFIAVLNFQLLYILLR